LEELKPRDTVKDILKKDKEMVDNILNIIILTSFILAFISLLVKFILSKV